MGMKTLRGLLGAAAIAMVASAANAQYQPPAKRVSPAEGMVAQLKPKGETPRTPDGHPDLTGYWGAGPNDSPYSSFGIRGLQFLEPDQAVMQRGNAWSRPLYKPELWEKVYNTDYGKAVDDPGFNCKPHGVPRVNAPQHIVQTAKEFITVNGETIRFIPTDGRKRDKIDSDFDNYNGVPLGHWEGDTLVVESVGFTDMTWFLWTGYFHSNNMTVTERFRRVGDLLFYDFTVNDPEVLAQPWTSERYVKRLNPNPLSRVEEVAPCEENDADQLADPYYRG